MVIALLCCFHFVLQVYAMIITEIVQQGKVSIQQKKQTVYSFQITNKGRPYFVQLCFITYQYFFAFRTHCLIKRYLDCCISLSKSVTIYLLYHFVTVEQHKLYDGCAMGNDCCHTFDPFRLFITVFVGVI